MAQNETVDPLKLTILNSETTPPFQIGGDGASPVEEIYSLDFQYTKNSMYYSTYFY